MKTIVRQIMFLLLVFASSHAFANEGSSIIKGKVTTSEGRSAAGVTVIIKGKSKGAITDDDGNFILRNLSAGTYELTISLIGYQTHEETITLGENETSAINIQLQLTKKELDEVIVTSAAQSYKSNAASSSLRLQTPLLEIPQNIQIVTNKAIQDQQVISMSDGLIRNVSGLVRMEHWGDMYTNITARGSQIQAFRNGFNVVNSYWGPLTEDMSFVDHIEFVKGPAGFMLANGDPSGLYNVVTKKPTGQTKGEVTMTLGSFDLFRTSLDLDGKLSKDGRLLYRLNLSGQQKKSHRPNEYNDRYVVAPVISYKLDEKTTLTAEYVWQHAKMSNVGSFYIFDTKGYATRPVDYTMLPGGLPPTRINDHSLMINLQHQLGDNWKLTAQIARLSSTQQGESGWPDSVRTDGIAFRSISIWDSKSSLTLGQAFVNGEITTGSVQHRILGGVDIGNKEYFADWGQYHPLDTAGGAGFELDNPNLGIPPNGYPVWDRSKPIEERAQLAGGLQDQRYSSGYLQDELGLFNNVLRITAAARYTYVKQSYFGTNSAARFTPRFGASFSINRETSLYALYDQAFIPQAGRLVNGDDVKPITGSNIEFGFKKDWFGGNWNTTVAVYRIIKNHEAFAEPGNTGFSYEIGKKKSEGIEFDLRGKIARGFNLVANYAYTDSKVMEVADSRAGLKEGDLVPGFAKHTANAWLTYKVQGGALKGFGASAGFTYLLDRATFWDPSPAGGAVLPDYFKLDGGLFYEKDRFRITANVFNVLDDYLYTGSYYAYLSAYYWQTDPPRNFRFSVAYKF
jgi:iron complex outermembrane receptor protein